MIEKNEVVANCDHLANLKFSYQLPYTYTEVGLAMLASVLRSPTAVKVSMRIIDNFVAMRKFIYENAAVFQRTENIGQRQLDTDTKIERIFDDLENRLSEPDKGIFYDDQIFDGYLNK